MKVGDLVKYKHSEDLGIIIEVLESRPDKYKVMWSTRIRKLFGSCWCVFPETIEIVRNSENPLDVPKKVIKL